MVWSLALRSDDAKQDPVVYGTKFGVVFLAEGPRTASIQEGFECAQQSQRCGNDPAAGGGDDCNHTRVALWGKLFGQVREGRDLSEEMLSNTVCSRIY